MTEGPDTLPQAREWIAKAEGDLWMAELVLVPEGYAPFWGVAFHAQQCAEKYLKALLVFHGIPFRRVHDIGELLGLMPESWRPRIDPDAQSALTYSATTGRYPSGDEPDRRGAEETLAAARAVRSAVRALLPKAALEVP